MSAGYAALLDVLRRLRAPDGCDWDRAQTLASLRPYVLEEAHELVEALDAEAPDHVREELGDLLMQVGLLSVMAEERGWFGPDDVALGIRDKLVRRHPHVFAGVDPDDAPSWDELKAREGGKAKRGALDGVPRALPALLRAQRIGEKAAKVGYDWPDAEAVRAKVDEELAELDAAEGDARERELGDVLFALASWARHHGIDAEAALRSSLATFERRFAVVESEATEAGEALDALDAEELDRRWRRAKDRVG